MGTVYIGTVSAEGTISRNARVLLDMGNCVKT